MGKAFGLPLPFPLQPTHFVDDRDSQGATAPGSAILQPMPVIFWLVQGINFTGHWFLKHFLF
jgi:hypothetical protein